MKAYGEIIIFLLDRQMTSVIQLQCTNGIPPIFSLPVKHQLPDDTVAGLIIIVNSSIWQQTANSFHVLMINQTSLFTNVSERIRNIGNERQNINLFINELHLRWICIDSSQRIK